MSPTTNVLFQADTFDKENPRGECEGGEGDDELAKNENEVTDDNLDKVPAHANADESLDYN